MGGREGTRQEGENEWKGPKGLGKRGDRGDVGWGGGYRMTKIQNGG